MNEMITSDRDAAECCRCGEVFDFERDIPTWANQFRCSNCGKKHQPNDTLRRLNEMKNGGASNKNEPETVRRQVYVIKSDGGYTKIGISVNPEKRVSSLQTGNPNDLVLLAASEFTKAKQKEQELHRRYEQQRQNGEWFDLPEEEVISLVEELSDNTD